MRIVLILLLCAIVSTPVQAKPTIKETVKHYKISGKSLNKLKSQMRRYGPKGFWGYAQWFVEWTADCRVSVTVTITMPKLRNPSKTPAHVRKEFDEMYVALLAHERNHGKNGIRAAQEVEQAKCRNTDPIFAKYNKADKDYDRRTKHGFTEGVKLP